ncbi:MAG: hypothetical protein ACLSSW_01785 [Acutalibacteraceae bacterium]
MRIGLNFMMPFEDTVSISLNENNITARDLLDLLNLDRLETCRFLKIPGNSGDKLQTIEINHDNIGLTLRNLNFENDKNYTVIPLM